MEAARVRSGDAATMREMTDEQLGTAMGAPSLDARDQARIADEFDRRYPPAPLPAPAATGDAVGDLLADRAAIDDALDPLPIPEEWGALAYDESFGEELAAAVKGRREARHGGSPDGHPGACARPVRRTRICPVPGCRGRLSRLPAQQESTGRRRRPCNAVQRSGAHRVCPSVGRAQGVVARPWADDSGRVHRAGDRRTLRSRSAGP